MVDSRVSINRRYQFEGQRSDHWFRALAELISPLTEHHGNFHGWFVLASRPDVEFEVSSWTDWLHQVRESWENLKQFYAFVTLKDEVTLSCHSRFSELTLKLSSSDGIAAEHLATILDAALGLPRIADGVDANSPRPSGTRGVRQKYHIQGPANISWFETAVSLIEELSGPDAFVAARLRFRHESGIEHTFRDVPSWRSEVHEHWHDVEKFYLWTSTSRGTSLFDCDLTRKLLAVEIEATSPVDLRLQLSNIAEKLDLVAAPDDPYKYRRYARVFRIVAWKSNSAFADAVHAAVRTAFTAEPACVHAWLTLRSNGSEDLVASDDLTSFIEELRKPTVYDSADLYLEGPLGHGLGVFLDLRQRELTIRSSMDRKRFNDVVERFEQAIDLRLLKEVSSGEPVIERARPLDGLLPKLLLAALGLILSVEFIKEAIPRYSIEIAFPPLEADSSILQDVDTVNVQWLVKKSRWWDTREMTITPAAEVRLRNRSGSVVAQQNTREGESGSSAIPLAPGRYQLEIAVPSLGKSVRQSFGVTASHKSIQ